MSPTPEAREAARKLLFRCVFRHHSGNGKIALATDVNKSDFDAVVNELAALLDTWRPQWLPIESAPKDGRRFLFTNGEIVGTGFFVQKQHFAADSWQGARNTEATHYLPLPCPPRLQARENK